MILHNIWLALASIKLGLSLSLGLRWDSKVSKFILACLKQTKFNVNIIDNQN